MNKVSKLLSEFFASEQASSVILILCTAVSMAIANSSIGDSYLNIWHAKVGLSALSLNLSVEHWINDGLMAIFFLLIGLEIERELYTGELSNLRMASLPVFAAIGGMSVPALIHYLLNHGTITQAGAGIPMATDIAFALGVLALLGNKVPISLKIFLTALAIIDDLGAIIIIAIFYVADFSMFYLILALGIWLVLLLLNRLGVNRLAAYLLPGLLLWYFMLRSGVHATIAGVLLAFVVPFRHGDESSPSFRLQHALHKPVAFGVMPLFALANTGIVLANNWTSSLFASNGIGISAGLLIGKPLGITFFSLLAVKTGLSRLPSEVTWRHILGVGILSGIGFTMSFFITQLAFSAPELVQSSKISILAGSILAGFFGLFVLGSGARTPAHKE